MRLLTVGDSFTYGDELVDRTQAWPHLLGADLGYEVTNLGKPGCSNNHMVRAVIENSHDHDLIIVAWSHYARVEISDENGAYDIWPGCKGVFFVGNLKYRKELVEYVNRHHDDAYLYKQYLINIILLQNYLEANNKRYVMIDTFGNPLREQRQTDQLVAQVNNKFYPGWPKETMMEWTWGAPKGPGGHFLDQGHQLVAEKINEHIRTIGWVS